MDSASGQYGSYKRGDYHLNPIKGNSGVGDSTVSRGRYSIAEGYKTQGMSEEIGAHLPYGKKTDVLKTNVLHQRVENFLSGNNRQSVSTEKQYHQRKSSGIANPKKSNQQRGVYSGSNYSKGQASEKRVVTNPVTSTSQTQLRQQESNPEIPGSSVNTASEPQAKITKHKARSLSGIEKKTAKLANGIKEIRENICQGDYKKYLESAVGFMISVDCFSEKYRKTPKKAEITTEDFAAFFQFQRAFKKGEEAPEITLEEFNKKRQGLGLANADSREQVEQLIDLLGGLGTRESILNIYQNTFTDDMKKSIRRAVYSNAIDRFSKQVGEYENRLKKSMMSGKSIANEELSKKAESDSKSSGNFGLKVLDDLKISHVFIKVMGGYIENGLTGAVGYAEKSGLLKKKDANISAWSRSEVDELFEDLHIVAEYHLTKPCYDASKNVHVKPKRNSGDYDIKSALRQYLRDGNHQFTDEDVLEQTSSYSRQLEYQGSKTCDIHIRELQTKYYDPRFGKKETLSFFHKFDVKSQQSIRRKVVEQFVEALFAVRNELKSTEQRDELKFTEQAKKTEGQGQSGAGSSTEPTSQIAIPNTRGRKYFLKSTLTNLLPKKLANATKGAESMMNKVTEFPKREKALNDRFLKTSALNKVRHFINDMAEFQAVKRVDGKSFSSLGKQGGA